MNARLSQALADRRAHADKRRLLDPRFDPRPRTPLWLWPLLCALLAALVWPELWRWYGLGIFCWGAANLLVAMIEAGDAAKRERS